MHLASAAINEFLARIHPYRYDDNAESAVVRMNFMDGSYYKEGDGESSRASAAYLGKGDDRPLLSMPELSEREHTH